MSAVLLENVWKRFKKFVLRSPYTTLKSELTALRFLRRNSQRGEYIEVLKGINLAVPRGTTVGIIGRNGSGKSTLLKVIAGIYKPGAGRVATQGRVSTLIELGAGFHPEFTGRENIHINGLIVGLSKRDIRRRFDEIVQFAELDEFIDAPVRTYSLGMYMRLGFSVAVHVDPDILLVDEVLAVGDEAFARKCLKKMEDFKAQGRTIVLVSHDLSLVERWCDTAVLLSEGRVTAQGVPRDVTAAYRQSLAGGVA